MLFHPCQGGRGAGNLSGVRRNIDDTNWIVETLCAGLVGQELRASYFASVRGIFNIALPVRQSSFANRRARVETPRRRVG